MGNTDPGFTFEVNEVEDGNMYGREHIMKLKPSDKLAEIKERFFARLNVERQNMIR